MTTRTPKTLLRLIGMPEPLDDEGWLETFITKHVAAWEAERSQNAINVETLKAFQEAARERERDLQAEIARLRRDARE